jgi:hypothetical protein
VTLGLCGRGLTGCAGGRTGVARTWTGRTVARGASTRTVGGVARSFRDSVARTSRRATGARATRTELPPPRVVLPRVLRDEESLDELEEPELLDELERESSESRSRDDPLSSLPPRAASLMRPSCALVGAASTSTSTSTMPNHRTAPNPRIPHMLRRLTRARTRIRQGVVRIGQVG